ncbi:LysM peptidoglycan-binding domain-containing M23 family metallopeptidase [Fictibacillus barbaricus]|uniref:Murein DD-endopeptidase MepM/ murein hydrolase activator NlpD n=1 Tax=Fictibacillus barbaricus TaxID=182136 RepID=A0ABU1U3U7_9BACL|nr:M23 family metallopeptidase [Fictibacillus barbaricus]MDR7074061.1 murein DD-endopeptidase MepM/ murein hydrolase activator NlpD [Fictibacillus barbaricus]
MNNRMTTERFKKIMMPLLMAAVVALLTLTMKITVTYAHHDDNELIKTVYHVYVDGEKIGTVRERSVVDDAIETIMQDAKAKNGDFSYTINQSIELKPEKMFRPEFDNEAAREGLAKTLSVSLDAYSIVTGGQTVAYVSSEQEAEDVLLKMKLEHASKEDIDLIEKAKAENKKIEIPNLQPGESKVIDVDFSNPVFVKKAQTSVKDLVSVDEAISRLKEGRLRKKEHIIQKGETLETIAQNYHMTMEQFFTLNPKLILTSVIREGNEVLVQEKEPFTEVLVYEASRTQRDVPYTIEKQDDSTMEKGETKTVQKGQNGLLDVTSTTRKAAGKIVKTDVWKQEQVKAPVTEIVKVGTKVIPSKGTGKFSWPAVGGYISSHQGMRWGRQHKGIDIARPSSKSIRAADNGKVVFAGWDGDYGNRVIIDHNNGMRTTYSHMSSLSVSVGDVVQKGSNIGVMGATGDVTGVHLHFEVYKNGALVNPESYL